jgi:DNA-binding beta-propeller fold protein YncE
MKRVFAVVFSLSFLFVAFATTAQAGYLYVFRNDAGGNQIYGFSVNEVSGATTLLPGFPLATGGTGGVLFPSGHLTIDQKNRRLYAINDGSDTVSAYSIDPGTGALTPLPFSPLTLEKFASWTEVAIHPSGSPLIIGTFQGKLCTYAISSTTASLVQNPFAIGTAPESSIFSRDGNFFYVGGISKVVGFSVNPANAILTELSGSPFMVDGGPVGYSMDSQGRLFLMEYGQARLRVFLTAGGTFTPVAGNPFNGLSQSVESVLHPNGNFLFQASRGSDMIGSYKISGTGAATTLSAITPSPVATGGSDPNALEINHAGTFLFTANANSRNLTTFKINSTSGVLTNVAVQPPDSLGATGYITGMDYIGLVVVSGRVVTAGGRNILGAIVTLTDMDGNRREARTNGSGYFRLTGVQAGGTHTLAVRHKIFTFAPQEIAISDELTELVIAAQQ